MREATISVRVLEAATVDGVTNGLLLTYLAFRQLFAVVDGAPRLPGPREILDWAGSSRTTISNHTRLLRAGRLLSPEWIMDPPELRVAAHHKFYARYDVRILRKIRERVGDMVTADFVYLLTFVIDGSRRMDGVVEHSLEMRFDRPWKRFQESLALLRDAKIIRWDGKDVEIKDRYLVSSEESLCQEEGPAPEPTSAPMSEPEPNLEPDPEPLPDEPAPAQTLDPESEAIAGLPFQAILDHLRVLQDTNEPGWIEQSNKLIRSLNERITGASRLSDALPYVPEKEVAAHLQRWFKGLGEEQIRELDKHQRPDQASKSLGRPLEPEEIRFYVHRRACLTALLPSPRGLIYTETSEKYVVPRASEKFPLTPEQSRKWEGFLIETWSEMSAELGKAQVLKKSKPTRDAARKLLGLAESAGWALTDPEPSVENRVKDALVAVMKMAALDFQERGDRRKGFTLNWIIAGFDRYRSELEGL